MSSWNIFNILCKFFPHNFYVFCCELAGAAVPLYALHLLLERGLGTVVQNSKESLPTTAHALASLKNLSAHCYVVCKIYRTCRVLYFTYFAGWYLSNGHLLYCSSGVGPEGHAVSPSLELLEQGYLGQKSMKLLCESPFNMLLLVKAQSP